MKIWDDGLEACQCDAVEVVVVEMADFPLPEATSAAPPTTIARPRSHIMVLPSIWACLTPAGLPGGRSAIVDTVAPKASAANKIVDIRTAPKTRISPLLRSNQLIQDFGMSYPEIQATPILPFCKFFCTKQRRIYPLHQPYQYFFSVEPALSSKRFPAFMVPFIGFF